MLTHVLLFTYRLNVCAMGGMIIVIMLIVILLIVVFFATRGLLNLEPDGS